MPYTAVEIQMKMAEAAIHVGRIRASVREIWTERGERALWARMLWAMHLQDVAHAAQFQLTYTP